MDTLVAQPAKRKRRRHSEEFRAKVVMACRKPGVSVAAVALEHGLNANLVRRWIKEQAARSVISRPPLGNADAEPLTVVPVQMELSSAVCEEEIRLDIRRDTLTVQMAWPLEAATSLGQCLRELLR